MPWENQKVSFFFSFFLNSTNWITKRQWWIKSLIFLFSFFFLSIEFNAEGKTLGYLVRIISEKCCRLIIKLFFFFTFFNVRILQDKYSGNFVYPQGLYNILQHIKNKYQNPKIYITENGLWNIMIHYFHIKYPWFRIKRHWSTFVFLHIGIPSINITNPLIDIHRIKYLATHLNYTKAAIE